MNSILGLR